MTAPSLRPADASAEGWRIDALLDSSVWVAAVLGVLVIAYLTWAVFRWRARADRTAAALPTTWKSIAVPVALTFAMFLLVDVPLFVRSTRDLYGTFLAVDSAARVEGAVRVEVNAQRWAWNIRYAGLDGAFTTDDDVVSMNDLRLPLGRPAVIQLASSDVVHSFYLPSHRVKLDAVPGRVQATWFRPTKLGIFEIACAEHCGVHHHLMRGEVVVMAPEAFDAWLVASSRDALGIASEDQRARKEEPSRGPSPDVDALIDPADARGWGWPWRQGAAR